MRKIIFLLIFGYLVASEIFVGASSNLTYVIPEIVKIFNKKYPNIKVKVILSSSGKLTAQILRGAPYDIFLSADMKYPKFIYSQGIGVFSPKIYAKGKIGFFSLTHKNFKDLKNYDNIVISKPNITPYGKAAMEALKNLGVLGDIKDKLVYAQSVSSVLYYVENGADVGIISKSLIFNV